MSFYTNVSLDGNNIHYRGVDNGKRIQKKIVYKPKLYIRSPKGTVWKTLDGEPLAEQSFPNIWEARNFIKKYKEIENFKIYGNNRWPYAFIADTFPKLIEYDVSAIRLAFIDIEVDSSKGFAEPETASAPITAITVWLDGKYHTFAYREFAHNREDVIYTQCADEFDLIEKFLTVWENFTPDIVTGWNINTFDIPYVINRITGLLGAEVASRISPWDKFTAKTDTWGSRELHTYDIMGVAIIDYLDLYRKYAPQPNQESYKLDNIADVELSTKAEKQAKVDFRAQGYTSLDDLYQRNHQLYMEYNIHDVELIRKLEAKLRLLELTMTLAYMTKTNYEDVFSQGRMWDAIIYNKLKNRNIAVPPVEEHRKRSQYEGAYVKEPKPGRYKWVVSFDLTSLYPHLIMMYNLSPETLVQPDDYDDEIRQFIHDFGPQVNVETLLTKQFDLSWLKKKKLTLTPNMQLFRTDKQGFLGEIMQDMYDSRATYKKLEIDAKKEYEKTVDEAVRNSLKDTAARHKATQSALKVTLNSAYGSLGNQFFRFFDIRIAEAITLSAQLSIRWIQQNINAYLNRVLKTENIDYVIASDTDSVYLCLDEIVEKQFKPNMTGSDDLSIVKMLDLVCEKKIKPFIDQSYNDLADYVNAYSQKMVMKREAIADQAVWTAKKNYILSVYNNEGVEYNPPDIKITGLAAIKSSTPKICKTVLKDTIRTVMTGTEKDVIAKVSAFKADFMSLPVIDVACPSGIRELAQYADQKTIFGKGTPMHVKGALVFNHFIKHHNIEHKYQSIRERDKIKYILLKNPNPFQSTVIAFLDEIPSEFGLDSYIDREAQFTKCFANHLNIILDAVGWALERQDSLDDFFGGSDPSPPAFVPKQIPRANDTGLDSFFGD